MKGSTSATDADACTLMHQERFSTPGKDTFLTIWTSDMNKDRPTAENETTEPSGDTNAAILTWTYISLKTYAK